MANSSDVSAGDDINASQYNNLRLDVLDITTGHTHNGTDSKIALAYGFGIKRLTTTTAAAEGGLVSIAHGLDPSQLLSITALIHLAGGNNYPPNFQYYAGYEYNCYSDSTEIWILNHATNSENILTKTIEITIIFIPS